MSNNEPDGAFVFASLFSVIVGSIGIWLHSLNFKSIRKIDALVIHNSLVLHYHLTLANLGVVVAFPFRSIYALFNRFCLGTYGCQLYAVEGMTCGMTAILLACTICIVHRFEVTKAWKLTRASYHGLAMGAWAVGFIWAVLPLLGIGSYSIGPHQTACTLDISRSDRKSLVFLLALTIFGYLIPVGSAILSLRVAWSTVVSSSDREKCIAGKLDVTLMEFLVQLVQPLWFVTRKEEARNPKNKLTERNRLAGQILFFTCLTWLPMGVLATCVMIFQNPNWSRWIYYVPQLLAKVGSALAPLAYSSTLRGYV
ncbi:retinochrome [Clonorchis sinensis]|uniref:Retinochrome n=1 Tax=Clonorchis sinensis TaxID=79923 RepID=G7YJG0_CLOSI|nr:retinochrome [Clonorchis sinensis]